MHRPRLWEQPWHVPPIYLFVQAISIAPDDTSVVLESRDFRCSLSPIFEIGCDVPRGCAGGKINWRQRRQSGLKSGGFWIRVKKFDFLGKFRKNFDIFRQLDKQKN